MNLSLQVWKDGELCSDCSFQVTGEKMPGGVDDAMVQWCNGDILRAQAGAGNTAWSKNASSLVPPTLHNPVPLSAGGWQWHWPWVYNGNRCLDVTLQEVEDRVPPHPWQEIVWRLAQCLGRDMWHGKRRKQKEQNNEEAAVWWSVCLPVCWPWCGTTRRSWWWQCIPLARQCCSAHERWGCRQHLRR